MEEKRIVPEVQEITIKLKKAIAEAGEAIDKARLLPERKDEFREELEKVSFVVETLFLENNLGELEKSYIYVESLRLNIPHWESAPPYKGE